jgi:hypothetical protein
MSAFIFQCVFLASRGQLDEIQIQKWLNHKFPNGFSDLQKALERLDAKQMGTVSHYGLLNKSFIKFLVTSGSIS